jgi:O-antigen ligase
LFFAPAIFLFIILLLSGQNFIFSLFIILIYGLFSIAFINNKLGLFLLILLRPCLDYFGGQSTAIAGLNLNFADIFAILTIAFCFYTIAKNLHRVKELPLLRSWLFFIMALSASLLTSINITTGPVEITRILSSALIFYTAFVVVENNKDLSNLIKIIIVSAFIPSAVAIYQFFTQSGLTVPYEGVYNRVFGTFTHPNMLAFYLVLVLALCFVVYLISDKKKVTVTLFGLIAILYLVALALTYTRSAWLGLLLIIVLLGLTRFRKFLIISLVILGICYFSFQQINSRVQNLTSSDPSSSVQWRIQMWHDSIGYAMQRPILGYGIGNSNQVILDNRGQQYGSDFEHNDYIRVALDAGLIGLVAFLVLILNLLSALFKIYQKEKKPRLKILAFVIFILAISFYLISFGDNILTDTALEWSLWALLGGLLATQIKEHRTKSIEQRT